MRRNLRILLSAMVLMCLGHVMKAQTTISLYEAAQLYHSAEDEEAFMKIMEDKRYLYYGRDSDGAYWWYKDCEMADSFALSNVNTSASIVCLYEKEEDRWLQLFVFDKDVFEELKSQLQYYNFTVQKPWLDYNVCEYLTESMYNHHPRFFISDDKMPVYKFAEEPYVIVFAKTYNPASLQRSPILLPSKEYVPNIVKGILGPMFEFYSEHWQIATVVLVVLLVIGIVLKNDIILNLFLLSILTPIIYYVTRWAMHLGVVIAMLKEKMPDISNWFLVINDFSVAGFISHIIGMFWSAVWCGASVAFPLFFLSVVGVVASRTVFTRLLYLIITVGFAAYAIWSSYYWVSYEAETASEYALIDIRMEEMYDYWILFVGHLLGGLMVIIASFISFFTPRDNTSSN